MFRQMLMAIALLSLAACANTASLQYVPTLSGAPRSGIASVSQVSVVDKRGEADPTWYGAIRGGFGNPLKTLHTPAPLNQVVAKAFEDALRARHVLAPAGRGKFAFVVTIVEFKCDQVVRREADVTLRLSVVDIATGHSIYQDEVARTLVTGSALSLDTGIFSAPADLQSVAQTALNQAIDALLDKPGLTVALNPALAA